MMPDMNAGKMFSRDWWIRAALVLILFILFDTALNYTLYNPVFITPLYAFAAQHHLFLSAFGEEQASYPLVSIRQLNWGLYPKPRAMVAGVVTAVVQVNDGDWHVDVTAPDGTIVTEFIPEYPISLPHMGEHIRIWGIPRFDIEHRWSELHPVIGWQKSN